MGGRGGMKVSLLQQLSFPTKCKELPTNRMQDSREVPGESLWNLGPLVSLSIKQRYCLVLTSLHLVFFTELAPYVHGKRRARDTNK